MDKLTKYTLGDDNLGNPRACELNREEIRDIIKPINHAPAPGCPDGDCKGFVSVAKPNTRYKGPVGQD